MIFPRHHAWRIQQDSVILASYGAAGVRAPFPASLLTRAPRIGMKKPATKQICYIKNSSVAPLAKSLGRGFRLVPLDRSSQDALAHSMDPRGVVFLVDIEKDDWSQWVKLFRGNNRLRLVALVSGRARSRSRRSARAKGGAVPANLFACLPREAPRSLLKQTVLSAFASLDLAERERAARDELERTRLEMDELNRIGLALSSTHDVNALLNLILERARAITSADAGSLYLVEDVRPEPAPAASTGPPAPQSVERRLRFKLTQNDSRQFPFTEFTLPMTEQSMAGYVALHGEVVNLPDAYAIPSGRPFQFNARYDQETGYRTRSVLTLPMKNPRGEILGVLQLINCKNDPASHLTSLAEVDRAVRPFSERAERLGRSLASQAAVAYENGKLYQDIETLFEGFVSAAVTAIEQRDPTTSGHSQRVSQMTISLAETVDRVETGAYAAVRFTPEQMKELRYAALLHDFGKVGVREEVLVKARKLYPTQLALVQHRFDYIRKELEAHTHSRKTQLLLERGRDQALAELTRLDEEYRRRLAEIDDAYQFILQVNEPTVLPEGQFEHLIDIARNTYVDPRGIERNFLTPEEVRFLSIPKGSLDPDERLQIESHVVHSFNFLMQIPWTREIRDIPWIARAHHEKLDGSGYPYRLRSDEIPLQAKMMTVCDIFDALSAADRPYKKAVQPERALEILEMSVRQKELDPDLFRLFVEAKIFQLIHKRS